MPRALAPINLVRPDGSGEPRVVDRLLGPRREELGDHDPAPGWKRIRQDLRDHARVVRQRPAEARLRVDPDGVEVGVPEEAEGAEPANALPCELGDQAAD